MSVFYGPVHSPVGLSFLVRKETKELYLFFLMPGTLALTLRRFQ